MTGSIRLAGPEEIDSYYLNGELRIGRVEICINDVYGTICDETWDNKDASVVCKQLGFSPYGTCVMFPSHKTCKVCRNQFFIMHSQNYTTPDSK